jgi:ABC-type amino acid transport substrate-binding protein
MKKMLLVVLLFVVVIGVVYSCEEKRDDNVIIVGLEAEYPPFNFLETRKTDTNVPLANLPGSYVDGYDVQMAKLIAAGLNKELVVKQLEWDALIPAVLNGEIDLIIAGMSPTAERKQEVNFTEAYYTSSHVAIVLASSSLAGATQLSAFNGTRGVGQKDTIYADLVDQLGAAPYNCTVLPVIDTVPQIITGILAGTADFTIVEKPVALGYLSSNPALALALDVPLSSNLFNVSPEDRDVSIALRKKDTDLLHSINEVLSTISLETREALMLTAINQSEE